MQIKRFEAKNMTTALRLIKGELGPEAVILSARSIRKGKGLFGSMKYSGVEVTAAVDNEPSKQKSSGLAGCDPSITSANPAPLVRDSQLKAQHGYSPGGLVKRTQKLTKQQPRDKLRAAVNHRALSALYQHILAQGVDRGIASEVIDEIKRIPAFQDLVMQGNLNAEVCTILEEMGVCADNTVLSTGRPNIVAFIGTAGAGKTTTIAKLAALQANRRQKKVAAISIDNYGIAANERLKAYARIIGFSMAAAVTPGELSQAIKNVKHCDLIFIDTPGVNPIDPHQIDELNGFLIKVPKLMKILVVSAATKEKDLIELERTIKDVGIQRMVFTKLDESRTHGNMLNMLVRTNLPVAYLCCGRKVAADLEAGSVHKLVDLIFNFEDQECNDLTDSTTPATENATGVQAPSDDRSYFVANKNSDVYHTTICKWSHKIKADNIIRFSSAREAEAQHFLPCRSCHPDLIRTDHAKDLRAGKRNFTSNL